MSDIVDLNNNYKGDSSANINGEMSAVDNFKLSDNKLILKISTPQITIEQEANIVNLPGSEGELGILPMHTNLIVSLKAGVIKVDFGDKQVKYFISEGIANIHDNLVVVVTDFTIDLATVIEETVLQKIDQLKTHIKGTNNEIYVHQLGIQKALIAALHQV